MDSKYEAVIGLEIHAQLLTDSKIFCGCSTQFGNAPNSNTCPICLGHPGVLPVLNKKVVEFTALMGLATDCIINEKSIFARGAFLAGACIMSITTPFFIFLSVTYSKL